MFISLLGHPRTGLVRLFRWWIAIIHRQDRLRARILVGALGLLTVCAACSAPSTSGADLVPTPPAQGPSRQAILPTQATMPTAAPPKYAPTLATTVASVVQVIDGDTVDVSVKSKTMRVQLIGINSPHAKDPRESSACFAQQATTKAKELLNGQTITLADDPSQSDTDSYDRLLRYIWLTDGRMLNWEMIAHGYAVESSDNSRYLYQAEFKQAERNARRQRLGMWSPRGCQAQRGATSQSQP